MRKKQQGSLYGKRLVALKPDFLKKTKKGFSAQYQMFN